MARGRMIDKNFFQSHEWQGMCPQAVILIGSMLVNADDNGRHPYVNADWLVRRYLAGNGWHRGGVVVAIRGVIRGLIEERSVLEVVVIDGVKYYQFTNFHRYQRLKRSGIEEKRIEEKRREGPKTFSQMEKEEREAMYDEVIRSSEREGGTNVE